MRLLWVMRHAGYIRNFESTLRMLAERGHEIDVVADTHPLADTILARIGADWPAVRHVAPPAPAFRPWSFLGLELRRRHSRDSGERRLAGLEDAAIGRTRQALDLDQLAPRLLGLPGTGMRDATKQRATGR